MEFIESLLSDMNEQWKSFQDEFFDHSAHQDAVSIQCYNRQLHEVHFQHDIPLFSAFKSIYRYLCSIFSSIYDVFHWLILLGQSLGKHSSFLLIYLANHI
jgi:hypothetical protein